MATRGMPLAKFGVDMNEFVIAPSPVPKAVQSSASSTDWLRCHSSDDVDAHCAGLLGWRMRYDQLGAGAFQGSFADVLLPRMQVFREVTNRRVRQRGRVGGRSFGVALAWDCPGEVNVNGMRVMGDVALACFDAEVDMCTPDDCELRGLVMDAELIEDALQCMERELASGVWHRMRALRLPPASLRRLQSLLRFTQDAMENTPWILDDSAARKHLADSFLLELTEALPCASAYDDYISGAARKRTVDKACEMMLAHCDESLSILDVCKAVGASRRKLNYCFLEVVGTSPIRYLRALRLNAVRRELKQCQHPAHGVHDVATRWGFWHFSQFSLDYKRQFAELPSETLRRARAAYA
jgi:AraC family ethanolamine operon transcriptional activator